MENKNIITIEILKTGEAEFHKRLQDINKRIPLTIIDRSEYRREFPFGGENTIELDCVSYTLEGERVDQIKGFSYVGSLTADGSAKVYYSHNDDENIKDVIESSLEFPCYHCNRTMSNRKSRLVFKKNDNSEIVSFGSKCSQDYFGVSVIKKLEKHLTYINRLIEECEEDFRSGVSRIYDNRNNYKDYMKVCIHHFINDGIFRSKAQSDELFNPSTSETLLNYILSPNDRQDIKDHINEWLDKNALPEGTSISSEIEKIQDYYEALESKSDFDENMKQQICNIGSRYGIICYAVFSYYKNTLHNQKEKDAQEGFNESVYYPEDKAKVENEIVTVVSQKQYESDWGVGYITTLRNNSYTFVTFGKVTLKDKNGNYIINEGGLEKGQQIKIVKATVKDRKEYNEKKQTIINRIKIDQV